MKVAHKPLKFNNLLLQVILESMLDVVLWACYLFHHPQNESQPFGTFRYICSNVASFISSVLFYFVLHILYFASCGIE